MNAPDESFVCWTGASLPMTASRESSEARLDKRKALDEAYSTRIFGSLTRLARLLITSESVSVQVTELPLEGQPADFRGAMGSFEVRASATPSELSVGERLEFLLTIEAQGVTNHVVDPASIEVSRRKRNAKTDRLDVQKLAQLLARHCEGEGTLRVVRVPPRTLGRATVAVRVARISSP